MQSKNHWQEFVEKERAFFGPILKDLGFELSDDQPHVKGERSAFRAKKIILLGVGISDKKKVVVKCARNAEGTSEILQEKQARENLKKVDFAYHEFLDPQEVLFLNTNGYLIQITEFITEDKKFLDRTSEDQFNIVYRSFVTQEGIHAVTAKHNKIIKKLFNTFNFDTYSQNLDKYKKTISNFGISVDLIKLLESASHEFQVNKNRISQYLGFLTHTDFVPHNFRVRNDAGVERVYLLDHSAIIIGNKHDGWARFLNFCVLHSPVVEKWFLDYFKFNRSPEENESLRLMRIYRLFELVAHHATIYNNEKAINVENQNGQLLELSKRRVLFWLELLKAIFENKELDQQILQDYKHNRDSLRSQAEIERQKVLY